MDFVQFLPNRRTTKITTIKEENSLLGLVFVVRLACVRGLHATNRPSKMSLFWNFISLCGILSFVFFMLRVVQFVQIHFLRGAQDLKRYGSADGYWARK